ncbi:hypothetical protein AAVH_40008 [Aphelenchoides avenae]|nr:hypothetical protein AAVH_40008 [Aphelenchus avenae]
MSSIQQIPVEILLDAFRANDPADTEALRLTCRHFHATILQNVGTLPTRLGCDLNYCAGRVNLYPDIYQLGDETSARHSWYPTAYANESPKELQDMHQTIGRTCDAPLMHLVEHFPSVKRAVRLDMKHADFAMPTEAALHFFERLETIAMDIGISKESFFWSDLFALKVFRRVSNIITYNSMPEYQAQVDDGALFEFITDFSLMPADKPRVVQLGPFTDDSIDALKRRFNKNIASIGGQVCAIVLDRNSSEPYLTNMASGSQKKALAKQLLRAANSLQP